MPLNPTHKESILSHVAAATEGFTGAELEGLCREAALVCMREEEEEDRHTHTHTHVKCMREEDEKEVGEDTHTDTHTHTHTHTMEWRHFERALEEEEGGQE
jgi:SpoVK/Ycf46/Vps4 family AAA+-type ATPase